MKQRWERISGEMGRGVRGNIYKVFGFKRIMDGKRRMRKEIQKVVERKK